MTDTQPRRILIVDDHNDMRSFIRSMIETEENNIVEGINGVEAVDLFQSKTPDLVLMDLEMPVMNGLAATEKILKLNSKARVIVITQHESDVIHELALSSGAVAFLPKSELSQLPSLLAEHPALTSNL